MKKLLIIPLLYASINLVSCTTSGYVTERPNQPVYNRPIARGPGYVWVDGDWIYNGNRYVWHEGHWARVRGNRQWETGTWIQNGNRYTWRRGHWHR